MSNSSELLFVCLTLKVVSEVNKHQIFSVTQDFDRIIQRFCPLWNHGIIGIVAWKQVLEEVTTRVAS